MSRTRSPRISVPRGGLQGNSSNALKRRRCIENTLYLNSGRIWRGF